MQISRFWLHPSTVAPSVVRLYVAVQQEKETMMTPLKILSEKLTAWRRYRDAVKELSQLTDRELNDIGLRRGEIEDAVRKSVMKELA